MASGGGENQKRYRRLPSTEKKEILDQGNQESCTAIGENDPCVTQSKTTDRQSSDASSDSVRADGGSVKNVKKSAVEHVEIDKSDIKAWTRTSSPSCNTSAADRRSSSSGGQLGHCVRTVAETSPMPDLFAQDEDGDTFLHIAIVQGDQPLTDFFIQRMKCKGIDIYNKLRQTPLHLAVITHQIHMVRKLIEGGADVNLMDRHGQTALHLACQEGDVSCVYAIRDVTKISRAAEIRLELKNSQGFSALHVATLNGSIQLTATILDMGAAIDEQDSNSGRTPLHHAVEAGKYHVAEYLISRGADVNRVTFAGNTPLHTASGRDMDNMVKLLLAHGADVNIANLEGDIPKVVRTSEQAKRQFRSKERDNKRRKR